VDDRQVDLSMRIYRQDERRHRAEVKSAKRAKRRGSHR
jgi:hypothetical protein